MSESIFTSPSSRPGPRRPLPLEPSRDAHPVTASQCGLRIVRVAQPSAAPARSSSADGALIAILSAPARPGETCDQAFRRKEDELVAHCATLAVVEAMALQRRLAAPAPGDQLAALFGRLVCERRNRILNFLAGARRRAAISTARR